MQRVRWFRLGALWLCCAPAVLAAQGPEPARVTLTVAADGQALAGAEVRSAAGLTLTDSLGSALLRLPPGMQRVLVWRLGYSADTLALALRAGQDTAVFVELQRVAEAVAPILVRAARSEVRIEEEPERVEVLAPEDVQEKTLTSPGTLTNLLVEMGGVQVQRVAPGLGGSTIRLQGLPGRYTLLLTDGLPLHGGQAPAFSLVQTPPLDLRQVEVIKGAASALYGAAALGGVVDLITRPPDDRRELLLSGTTQAGTDGLLWLGRRLSQHWGYTLLAGAHAQARKDSDADGWTDQPGHTRVEARPRLLWTSPGGSTLLITASGTAERREGGTMPGRTLADGTTFREQLDTRHWDAGAIGQFVLGRGTRAGTRAALTATHQDRRFGQSQERDRRTTAFGEATLALDRSAHDVVLGLAAQRDAFRTRPRADIRETFTTLSAFATERYTVFRTLSLSAAARVDRHSRYGTFLSPRLSALVRLGSDWSLRLSGARGFEAPSVAAGETEEVGFARLSGIPRLAAERGASAAVDVSGQLGPLQLNATWFGARIDDPVQFASVPGDPTAFTMQHAAGPIRSAGLECFAVYAREPFLATLSYSHTSATELSPDGEGRIAVPLTPRDAGGIDVAWEEDEPGEAGFRVALEVFYTGRQRVEADPFRTTAPGFTTVELLASKRFGRVTVFASGENLGNVRQANWDPLLLPSPGRGGRRTTDEWAPLEGRTLNAGVRASF